MIDWKFAVRRWRWAFAAFAAVCICCSAPSRAEDVDVDGVDPGGQTAVENPLLAGKRVIRVEEDWILDVAVAGDSSTAPEVVTVFGPADPNQNLHAVFELNHKTYPTFLRGGMQLQCWWGDWFVYARTHPSEAELATVIERITFTCVTRVNDHRLTFQVVNGQSVTYGTFGTDNSLRVRLWTERDNLNSYDPAVSIAHSRVTYGANRVNRYLRSEIRYFTDTGEVITDPTDAYVHQLLVAEEGATPINE